MSQINNIVTRNGNREPSGKTYKILEANQFMKYTGHYQYPPYSMAVKLETQERKDKSIITAAGMKLLRKKKNKPNYSHAPHNDVSVNDGPYIVRWSHNIIILPIVLQLPTVFSTVTCCTGL